jgi:hypothetical protein
MWRGRTHFFGMEIVHQLAANQVVTVDNDARRVLRGDPARAWKY